MSVLNENPLHGASGNQVEYQIEKSCRFNNPDEPRLTRAVTHNTKTFTINFWIKRGKLGRYWLYGVYSNGADTANVAFDGDGTLTFYDYLSSGYRFRLRTNRVFHDVGAWYCITLVVNTTESTSSNRIKMYVNGVQETSFAEATYPSQNLDVKFGGGGTHAIGTEGTSNRLWWSGYLAEWYLIDGQALTPASFGETDDDYGHWKPIKYAGTYGSGGYFLEFQNSGALGTDTSGNSNNWTSTNLAATDQMTDTPTNNVATWNPLFFRTTGATAGDKLVHSEGNTKVEASNNRVGHTCSTMMSSGKHYAEFATAGGSSITGPGVVRADWFGGYGQSYAHNYGGSYYGSTGDRAYNSTSDSQTAPGSNRIGIEVDFGGNEVTYFIVQSNGTRTQQGATLTSSNGINFAGQYGGYHNTAYGIFTGTCHDTSSRTVEAFFAESDWWGTPNADYVALSAPNLPAPVKPKEHFNTVLYTGNSSTNAITGVGFEPSLVWIKERTASGRSHQLFDKVRGVNKSISMDTTGAQQTRSGWFNSFDSDGFTTTTSDQNINQNSTNYASWHWNMGSSSSTNNNGTAASTVMVNSDASMSIVQYEGTGSTQTLGHGLGKKPSLILLKNFDTTIEWTAYTVVFGVNNYWRPNENTGKYTASSGTDFWPGLVTTDVFGVGNHSGNNQNNHTYIAYCFAEIEGYSIVGEYMGNARTEGPFIHCGFRPGWIWVKGLTGAGASHGSAIWDTARNPYNVSQATFEPNNANREVTDAEYSCDILSNGFKLRYASNITNGVGDILFIAFAECPMKYANAR